MSKRTHEDVPVVPNDPHAVPTTPGSTHSSPDGAPSTAWRPGPATAPAPPSTPASGLADVGGYTAAPVGAAYQVHLHAGDAPGYETVHPREVADVDTHPACVTHSQTFRTLEAFEAHAATEPSTCMLAYWSPKQKRLVAAP